MLTTLIRSIALLTLTSTTVSCASNTSQETTARGMPTKAPVAVVLSVEYAFEAPTPVAYFELYCVLDPSTSENVLVTTVQSTEVTQNTQSTEFETQPILLSAIGTKLSYTLVAVYSDGTRSPPSPEFLFASTRKPTILRATKQNTVPIKYTPVNVSMNFDHVDDASLKGFQFYYTSPDGVDFLLQDVNDPSIREWEGKGMLTQGVNSYYYRAYTDTAISEKSNILTYDNTQ